ncbi:GNAT family N-acetyltransferase [Salimicrobium halophilum]|uniref:Acetyltransferase (GNAT) family protein n=1 Tax=Salimicrobium halophilum TaxID=86666 RepID=A0A1G8R217_9BACI|nr:GNAT family N-acetyltransferase [Salimicrobium halophilum]SDJ11019.1 Acetyltransferase (GNAT) family protein [Salimicrobium halophilum]
MIGIWNHEEPTYAEMVMNLQKQAYLEEAEWIGRDDLPPLFEKEVDIRKSDLIHLAETEQGELIGMLVFAMDGRTMDIHKLMVHPRYSRNKTASRLLEIAERWWIPLEITVSTAAGNKPALFFYNKHGFRKEREEEVEEGIVLAHFKKHTEREE